MECIWYNGETACYELLDFDPSGLSKDEIRNKAIEKLQDKYRFDVRGIEKATETIYLINSDDLKRVF